MKARAGAEAEVDPMGEQGKYVHIEDTSVFKKFEQIAGAIWNEVSSWENFEKWSLGKQLTEAADSVGFNLVEGDGRYSDSEAIHFFYIARGSARETKLGIRRALERRLIKVELAHELLQAIDEAIGELNGLISYRKRTRNVRAVREEVAEYNS